MNKTQNLEKELCKICCSKMQYQGDLYKYVPEYETLKKIISSKKIFHTDYRCFNDPTEVEYGKNIILDVLKRNKFQDLEWWENKFSELDDKWSVYVTCYSKKIDKLSLWRYYANNGAGFAIKFKSKKVAPKNNVDFREGYIISNVNYGSEAKCFINDHIKRYERITKKEKEDLKYRSILFRYLIMSLPSLKDKSFSDEHEVRTFYMEGEICKDPITQKPFFFSPADKEDKCEKSDIRFIKENDKKKTYLIHSGFEQEEISEIWVGSACNFSEAKKAIEELLEEHGYNKGIEIKECPLPFRHG